MDNATLQVLKYLARWREEIAIARNRARGFVISDGAMLQMAREKPASAAELGTIEGLHPVALSRYEDTLLQLIAEAGRDTTPVEKFEQLDEQQRAQLKQMRAIVTDTSAELSVDPALLGSRKELEKLIRARANGQALPERFLGWRKAVVTDRLLSV